jgi:uncharacterized protein
MWLEEIWRYPVKSMAGERLDEASLGELGVPGDRVAYVVDGSGETVSARTRPKLLALRGADVTAEQIRAAAGQDARLVRADGHERFDILPLLVATDGAVKTAGLDVRRLRPNLVIGGVDGLAETGWEGRYLRIGDAVVGLATRRGRCIVTTYDPDTLEQDVEVLRGIRRRFEGALALNAWTAAAGTVRAGDPVELLDSFEEALVPGWGRFVSAAAP